MRKFILGLLFSSTAVNSFAAHLSPADFDLNDLATCRQAQHYFVQQAEDFDQQYKPLRDYALAWEERYSEQLREMQANITDVVRYYDERQAQLRTTKISYDQELENAVRSLTNNYMDLKLSWTRPFGIDKLIQAQREVAWLVIERSFVKGKMDEHISKLPDRLVKQKQFYLDELEALEQDPMYKSRSQTPLFRLKVAYGYLASITKTLSRILKDYIAMRDMGITHLGGIETADVYEPYLTMDCVVEEIKELVSDYKHYVASMHKARTDADIFANKYGLPAPK